MLFCYKINPKIPLYFGIKSHIFSRPQARRQEMKWGCFVKKWKMGGGPFLNAGCIMYSISIFYFTFYLFGEVRTHPTHPPAYGPAPMEYPRCDSDGPSLRRATALETICITLSSTEQRSIVSVCARAYFWNHHREFSVFICRANNGCSQK